MQGCTGLLKERVRRKDILIAGCIMDSRSGAAVEMYHESGYDVLMIDREHTALNSETILEHIRMARALGMPCMVRAAADICLMWQAAREQIKAIKEAVAI